MQNSPIHKIVFAINKNKKGAEELATQLIEIVRDLSMVKIETYSHPLPSNVLKGMDDCMTIGGDGTLLGVVEEAIKENIPVLGINCGKLGFMTTFTAEEARIKLKQVLLGDYTITERKVLSCSSTNNEETILALNDLVIKTNSSRLAYLEVFSGEDLVNQYVCDGLVFSTPTGSTAYNLSAGGPLIHPHADVITMTPICPHTLSNRTIIFGNDTILTIRLGEDNHKICLSKDGKNCFKAEKPFPLKIRMADQMLKLIQQPNTSYYQVLRTKLKWGGV